MIALLLLPIILGLVDAKLPNVLANIPDAVAKLANPFTARHGGLERSSQPDLDTKLYNTTEFGTPHQARAIAKRDFQSQCNHQVLVDGFRQAEDILRDTLGALDLVLSLYDDRPARQGLFKPSKMAQNDRTSDENLAMATFVAFFHAFYQGESSPGVPHQDNNAGKARVEMIRQRTNDILNNVQAYNRGLRTTPRGTYGDVYLHCNENFWARVDNNGLTYLQAHPGALEPDPLGQRHLWARMGGRDYWYAMSRRCGTGPVAGIRDGITTNPNLYAFVTRNIGGTAPFEIMVFCAHHFNQGEKWDQGANNAYQLAALRKSRGQTALSALQQQFINQPRGRDKSIRHFNQFIATYIIHESSHARKIVGDTKATGDEPCNGNTPGWTGANTNTLTPTCLRHLATLANDDRSERDAHTYAVYAAATYASAIDWTAYTGVGRATW
ncbi:hypothetical protein B0T14DRAFT_569735 [Immersiella caudata]|uniref:Uncharacterized protein n=1 Tax=Immersiella caudata TaxID=314043 RepID=A0AA39WE38_9PEZI|nr:hypothetical protein B0T14DRAFT_569735 [Immersiella caudata]